MLVNLPSPAPEKRGHDVASSEEPEKKKKTTTAKKTKPEVVPSLPCSFAPPTQWEWAEVPECEYRHQWIFVNNNNKLDGTPVEVVPLFMHGRLLQGLRKMCMLVSPDMKQTEI